MGGWTSEREGKKGKGEGKGVFISNIFCLLSSFFLPQIIREVASILMGMCIQVILLFCF